MRYPDQGRSGGDVSQLQTARILARADDPFDQIPLGEKAYHLVVTSNDQGTHIMVSHQGDRLLFLERVENARGEAVISRDKARREEAWDRLEKAYADGIAWGEMKQRLFEYINEQLGPARDEYERLVADPAVVEAELRKGAERARELSVPYLEQIRDAIGIRRLG